MIGRIAFALVCGLALPAQAQDAISCILRPVHMLRIATPVAGLVAEMLVDRGDRVEAGQLLAQMNIVVEQAQFNANQRRAESEASLNVRRAQLQSAERKLAQTQALVARGVGTQTQLDEVSAELDIARSLLTEAEEARALLLSDLGAIEAALELRRIRAPVAGIILARHVTAGEFASSDQPILELVNVDRLHAEILFPAEMFGTMQVGDNIILRAEQGDSQRVGQINAIDPIIDAGSRSFGVRVLIDNADMALTAGTRCRVGL
jgi:RND family efflux transporter MFP subunit